MSNFLAWWSFCQAPNRDGSADDTDPLDHAGTTRWGWTYPTWMTARAYAGQTDLSSAAFMAMTQAQAGALAEAYFWDRLGGMKIPGGSDVSWIDFCWTSGGAAMEIQERLGIAVDGIVGKQTIEAIAVQHPATFIQQCHDWRIAYMDDMGLRSDDPGDYTRTDDCLALAKTLL